jgi:TonB family protein
VLIGAEGRAKEIEVLESSHPDFTKAARKSAQRSRYVPLMRQGHAEEAWVRIPFRFTLH